MYNRLAQGVVRYNSILFSRLLQSQPCIKQLQGVNKVEFPCGNEVFHVLIISVLR